jgi:PAS domain S-box-containing protein
MQQDVNKTNAELLDELRELRQRNIALETLLANANVEAEHLREVSETSLDAVIISDQDGNILFWNKRATEVFGYEKEEVLGNPITMLISDEAMGEYTEGKEHVLERGFSLFGKRPKVSIAKRKDGTKFPAEFTVSNWKIQDRYYFGSSLRDISEQKRVEEEYERILNMSQDLICIAGTDGYFKYVNPAWERMLGYQREELLARQFLDFIYPEDHYKNDAAVKTLSSGKMLSDFENRYFHKNGSIRYLSWTAAPSPEKGLIYCVGRDVTERKQHEKVLQQREERFRAIAESSTDAIIASDSSGKIIYCNKAIERIYGYTADELVGKSVEVLMPARRRPKFRKSRASLIKKGSTTFVGNTLEKVGVRKDGREVPVEVSASQWMTGDQMIFGGIVRDITQRKQMEAELRRSHAALEKKVKQRTVALKEANKRLQISEEYLKKFAGMLLSAREEERKNIAVTIHDEVGSMAIAVDSQISIAKEECNENNKQATFKALTKAQAALRKAVVDLRKLAVDLRPPNLEIMGLNAALTDFIDRAKEQTKLKIVFKNELGNKKISEDMAIVIYRVIQEALTNIMKHAKAKTARISLYAEKGI